MNSTTPSNKRTETIAPNRAGPPVEPTISVNDKTLYKAAIDKANKVVLYHPKSKYVDDALWLIGKARYNMTEFVTADKKLNELIVKVPKSKYLDDAYYYIGMSRFWLKNYEGAIEAFNNVLELKKSSYKDDAAFNIAYIDYLQGNFSSSATSFEDMLKTYPKSDSAAAAQFFVAVSYDSLRNLQAALDAFQKIKKYNPSRDLYFEANYAYGATALRADSVSLGMSIFKKLAKDEKYFDKSSIIRLKLAEGRNRLGDTTGAIDEYLKVAEQFPKTDQSAEAFYRLGIIYQDKLFDLEKAKDYFNKATQEKRDSEFRNLALARSAQISKLEDYRKRLGLQNEIPFPSKPDSADTSSTPNDVTVADSLIGIHEDSTSSSRKDTLAGQPPPELGPALQAMLNMTGESNSGVKPSQAFSPGDSMLLEAGKDLNIPQTPNADSLFNPGDSAAADTSTPRDDAEVRFLLAELYHHDLNQPDSALNEYLLLAKTYPDSKYAPMALLASAFIYSEKNDTAGARGIYNELMDKYPSSSQAMYALTQVEGATIPMENNVLSLYEQAEDQYFKYNNPSAAIAIFEHIIKAFPKSDYAVKSAYARAWIMEHTYAADGDSSVYKAYASIVDKYPETAYANDAKIRMGLVKREGPAQKKPAQKPTPNSSGGEPDSLEKARTDSLTNILPPAPPVLDSIAFVYPESLLNEGHREKGKVIFKIKLDLFGNIVDYELLGTSGNIDIDSVAVQTLRATTFDMSKLNDLSLLDGFFRYDIRFEPPQDWENRYEHADPSSPYYQERGGP